VQDEQARRLRAVLDAMNRAQARRTIVPDSRTTRSDIKGSIPKGLPCWGCGVAYTSGHFLSCPIVNPTTQQRDDRAAYDRLAGSAP
jgi:hypothetical protein